MPIGDLARSDQYLLDDDQPSRYPTASNMSIQPNYPPPAPPADARWLAVPPTLRPAIVQQRSCLTSARR